MADRQFRYCRERGCGQRTNHPSGWCAAHQQNNSYTRSRAQYDANRKLDPIRKLYNCADWTRFKEAFAGSGNVVCQRMIDGVRCRFPVEILHHIVSPRQNITLMYTPSNVVGVCRQHHPPTEGEPPENLYRLAEIYVPTRWREIRF